MVQRHRVKISATIDPDLLASVDAYVRQQPDRDRSRVIDEALWLWLGREQDRAMIEQYAVDDVPPHERRAWNAVRDAAAHEIFTRDRRGE
jgi:metal-responsive CopG/Arc/MetJ family transcriptional regulator